MKQNLREAQRNMKRIRMEAKAAGHTISKSNYETVQVSYWHVFQRTKSCIFTDTTARKCENWFSLR